MIEFLLALAPTLEVAPAQEAPAARIERRLAAMGTVLTVAVVAPDRPRALTASELAVRAIEETERRLSTWREDSELARLNATPVGEAFELSGALAGELAAANDVRRATGGAFEPGIGALVRAWDLRGAGRVPLPAEIAEALAAGGFGTLEWTRLENGGARVRRTSAGMRIEEGGFGKGAGLDRALEALRAAGIAEADLDLGGQVAVLRPASIPDGARSAAGKLVAVAHPDRRETAVVEVRLARGSLATSGNSERGIRVDGQRLGHLLDPRTGRPARDFGSLTVLASTALEADAFSTGLYVLGPDAALAFAAAREDLEVLVLERTADGLRARATPGLEARSLQPDLVLEVFTPPPASREADTDR